MAVAALLSRPRQAVLLTALGTVVTTAAALGPLYARAVDQSVLRHVVADATAATGTLVVTDSSAPVTSPEELAQALRSALPRELAPPVAGADVPVTVKGVGARLTARDDLCNHLRVSSGRCAQTAGELLLSGRTAAALHARVDDRLTVADGATKATLTVVGLYDGLDPSAPYWAGRSTSTSDADGAHVVDDLLTTAETLADTSSWPDVQTHLDIALRPQTVDLRRVDALRDALEAVDAQAQQLGAATTTRIPELLAAAQPQHHQSRDVILLLAVQLAVLGVVVLSFVGAAVTEQRRPEIALARLRGLGQTGATGFLLREMALLLLGGAVAGTAVAYVVTRVAALSWLEPGVPVELRRSVLLAALAALAAGFLGILAAATPTLRQPIVALLRRVPPRVSALRVGMVEGALVAAAAAGFVTLLYGDRGVVSLLGPGLVAIAGGLLLSQLVIPLATRVARRALRRGHIARAMAALQIARRPALRRLIAIITVACALLVFAADAWAVAARNRVARARLDTGAAVVLTVDAPGSRALRTTVLGIDPEGTFATPVVEARSAAPVGPRTTAVEPAAFRRIAHWGDAANKPRSAAFAPLTGGTVPAVPMPAGTTAVTVVASYRSKPLPTPRSNQDPARPVSLELVVQHSSGAVNYLEAGVLQKGRQTFTAPVTCSDCMFSGFVIKRMFGDASPVELSLTVEQVQAEVGSRAVRLDLGPPTDEAWQVLPSLDLPTTAQVQPGPPLTIVDLSSFTSAEIRRGDVPATTPALVAGNVPPPFRQTSGDTSDLAVAPDLASGDHLYTVTARIRLVPRAGTDTVLTDLRALNGTTKGTSPNTSYEVWLAADDPSRERALRRDLAAHGLQVIGRDTPAAHERAFAREGPTLALRLALLAGVLALLLAAVVLVVGVATSGAARARDLAGLRVVGVPDPVLRRSAVMEHLVVAVLGAVAGTALGVAAAQAALPDVPMFATRSALLPVRLDPAWTAVGATGAVCVLLLCAVSVLVGRAIAGAARPDQLRESA